MKFVFVLLAFIACAGAVDLYKFEGLSGHRVATFEVPTDVYESISEEGHAFFETLSGLTPSNWTCEYKSIFSDRRFIFSAFSYQCRDMDTEETFAVSVDHFRRDSRRYQANFFGMAMGDHVQFYFQRDVDTVDLHTNGHRYACRAQSWRLDELFSDDSWCHVFSVYYPIYTNVGFTVNECPLYFGTHPVARPLSHEQVGLSQERYIQAFDSVSPGHVKNAEYLPEVKMVSQCQTFSDDELRAPVNATRPLSPDEYAYELCKTVYHYEMDVESNHIFFSLAIATAAACLIFKVIMKRFFIRDVDRPFRGTPSTRDLSWRDARRFFVRAARTRVCHLE